MSSAKSIRSKIVTPAKGRNESDELATRLLDGDDGTLDDRTDGKLAGLLGDDSKLEALENGDDRPGLDGELALRTLDTTELPTLTCRLDAKLDTALLTALLAALLTALLNRLLALETCEDATDENRELLKEETALDGDERLDAMDDAASDENSDETTLAEEIALEGAALDAEDTPLDGTLDDT